MSTVTKGSSGGATGAGYAPRAVPAPPGPPAAAAVDVDSAELSRLERSQRARRDRIIGAVLDLAAEGGYDAVQVRDVARRADVALRTVYNYYGSREGLLQEALAHWRSRVAAESAVSIKGTTFEERILSQLRHNFEVYEQQPKLFQTFMRASFELRLDMTAARTTMLQSIEDELAELDPDFVEDFGLILSSVIYMSQVFAASGQLPLEEVWPRIERTVRRLAQSKPVPSRSNGGLK